jgi:hypothetical protein
MPTTHRDPYARTGRTTGLIFEAFGRALLNPGKQAILRDHYQNTHRNLLRLQHKVYQICEKCGLNMEVKISDECLLIRSLFVPEKPVTEKPQDPPCTTI